MYICLVSIVDRHLYRILIRESEIPRRDRFVVVDHDSNLEAVRPSFSQERDNNKCVLKHI